MRAELQQSLPLPPPPPVVVVTMTLQEAEDLRRHLSVGFFAQYQLIGALASVGVTK